MGRIVIWAGVLRRVHYHYTPDPTCLSALYLVSTIQLLQVAYNHSRVDLDFKFHSHSSNRTAVNCIQLQEVDAWRYSQ